MLKIVLFLALFSISLSVVSSVGPYCPYLNYPSYGYISTSQGYVYGSVATYSCQKGYYLHGNAQRYCLNSGVWGGVAPTCCKFNTCLASSNEQYLKMYKKKIIAIIIHICHRISLTVLYYCFHCI